MSLFKGYYVGLNGHGNVQALEDDVYTKDQVDIFLGYKLDSAEFSSSGIQQKLNAASLHVLDQSEYDTITTITEKAVAPATTTQGYVPAWDTQEKTLVNGHEVKGTINETPSTTALVTEYAVVEYVSNNTVSNATGTYRKDNVLAIADYEVAPPTTNEGDRYILSKVDGTFDTGAIESSWGSVLPGDVVYYESGAWKQESEQSPDEGWTIYIEDINMYAVLAVGTVTKWVIGSFAQPVDVTSDDTSKTKMVSNAIIKALVEHEGSDHFDKIDNVVNKAFIEGKLTGEIASHWHPPSIDPISDLHELVGDSGEYYYPDPLIEILVNKIITNETQDKFGMLVFNGISLEGGVTPTLTTWEHPYSMGDRRGVIGQTCTYGGHLSYKFIDGIRTEHAGWDQGILTITFPEIIQISEVRNSLGWGFNPNLHLEYSLDETNYFTANLSVSPINCKSIRTDLSISGGRIGDFEFKCGESTAMNAFIVSGEDFVPTKIYDEKRAYLLEMHFPSFPISSVVHQDVKGYTYVWPYPYNAKILKLDVFSSSASTINATINATPIFQSGVQTGSGWAYSGLVTEGANNINQGDELEITSTASGSNLFVRIWYIATE